MLSHCDADGHKVRRLYDAQIHESKAGQRHAGRHRPERFAKSEARSHDTADDAACKQGDDADSTVYHAHYVGSETETAAYMYHPFAGRLPV